MRTECSALFKRRSSGIFTTVLSPREASQDEVLLLEVTSVRSDANFASLAFLITRCARELIADIKVVARWYSAGVLLL